MEGQSALRVCVCASVCVCACQLADMGVVIFISMWSLWLPEYVDNSGKSTFSHSDAIIIFIVLPMLIKKSQVD